MATELAALAFYVITGYKFQPAIDNPYMPVRAEAYEGAEYGLEENEEGLELIPHA